MTAGNDKANWTIYVEMNRQVDEDMNENNVGGEDSNVEISDCSYEAPINRRDEFWYKNKFEMDHQRSTTLDRPMVP